MGSTRSSAEIAFGARHRGRSDLDRPAARGVQQAFALGFHFVVSALHYAIRPRSRCEALSHG